MTTLDDRDLTAYLCLRLYVSEGRDNYYDELATHPHPERIIGGMVEQMRQTLDGLLHQFPEARDEFMNRCRHQIERYEFIRAVTADLDTLGQP